MPDMLEPDFMASEDMQVLMAINKMLQEKLGKFCINLPGGSVLTNDQEMTAYAGGGAGKFSFTGVDTIKDTLDKIMLVAGDSKYRIVMPSAKFQGEVEIGKMFDMPVFASSLIPQDRFLIQEIPEEKST